MASSLTRTAINTRKSIKYGIYFVFFMIGAQFAFRIGASLYKVLIPPKLPPPTVSFGPLPAIKFPESPVSNKLTYTLETATGGFPATPTQLPVYYIKPPSASLFSADTATQKARALGFSGNPNQLKQTLYEFIHTTLPKRMEINIVTGEYSIGYNLTSDRSPLLSVPPDNATAISRATSILTSAQSLPSDVSSGPKKIDYLKIKDQDLVNALSLSDAALTRVNLYRKGYGPEEAYGSVTPVPNRANIWVLLSGDRDRERELVAAEYRYYEVDEEQSSTYPLKKAEVAYDDLVNGRAFIARFSGAGVTETKIRNIYLAYYDAAVQSEFYQPVYVFEGDNEFMAYVPAIVDEYYGVE